MFDAFSLETCSILRNFCEALAAGLHSLHAVGNFKKCDVICFMDGSTRITYAGA